MNIKEVLENACGTLTILTGEDISADFTHDELPGGADYMPGGSNGVDEDGCQVRTLAASGNDFLDFGCYLLLDLRRYLFPVYYLHCCIRFFGCWF